MSAPQFDETAIRQALENVIDPELGISIVDLGLIYEINQAGDGVHIVMTLTTIGCPLFGTIQNDMMAQVVGLGYSQDKVEIELVFDPPWSMKRMSESARAMLGI